MTLRAGRYLYRSVRRGDRVATEYYGSGDAAELMAAIMADDAERAAEERHRIARRIRRAVARDRRLAGFCDLVQELFVLEMRRSGYHQHERTWRKAVAKNLPTPPVPADPPPSPDDVDGLMRRADRGDATALPDLRRALAMPRFREPFLEHCGDAAAALAESYARRIEPRLGTRLCILERADQIRDELAPPGTPPLERLLASRIATTWLACHAAEAVAMRQLDAGITVAGAKVLDVLNRASDRAGRRFNQAVRALDQLRRADPPTVAVQINTHKIRGST